MELIVSTPVKPNDSLSPAATLERWLVGYFKHLLQYKENLSKRNKDETGVRYKWYALQKGR